MVGRRGSRRAPSASSRLQRGPEQSHVETRQEQPRQETRTEQPRHETRVEQTRPNENVGNLTLEQLGQFIARTVDEAMRRNQESMGVGEQASRQEHEENVEVHQSRVEETQSIQSGEISEMGEMWKEIRMLRQQDFPRVFRQLNVGEYDGHTDPEEHLWRFENAALLHQYTDGVKCRVFLGTLVRSAQQWFNTLQPNSICSFEDFSVAFLHRFASSKRHQKNYLSLFVMKQQEAETLREFVQRFNNAALEIPAATPDIMISAFTQGLRGGEFFKSLVKKPPSSYDDLLARAEKYVNLEDAQRYRRMENRPGGSRAEGAEKGGRKRGAGEREEDKNRNRGPFSSHVPLNRNRDKVMEVRESEGRWEKLQRAEGGVRMPPVDRREGSSSGDRPKPRTSPRRGRGPPWINRRVGEPRREGQGQDAPRGPVEPRRRADEDNHPTRGMIHMILGGATYGDSGRARKAHGRRLENFEISRGADLPQDPVISFGPEDLRGIVAPHNDALVVTATIANYDVARIFIDNGSSVNILFKSTMDQMKVEGFEFDPVSTPLYGFAGHAIPPLGQITLPLSLGRDSRRVTKMITFTVVDTHSSYNGILGRPALKDFRAVASTYHQKLKFPVGKEVGVLCGDQKVARRCYEGIVKEEGKRARVEVNMIRRGRSGLPVVVGEVHEVMDEKPEIVTLGPDEKTLRIAPDLDPKVRKELIICLQANLSGFAWSAQELTGTSPDIAEHRLNILPNSRPVKQKKRHFGPEKDVVIKKEVRELLNAGHIREVQFPTWLSNVVLVPNNSGKWRMCVDFRDLNKACPKDCYPLPRIDQLVDSTARHQYLCMLDAYQGYHQIPLAVEDQDKVSFITSEGTFCYVVMPFGLKNAGATYQRLMDRVFSEQVGRNVEVYVDDIMVKSKDSSQLVPDLVETFATLKSYGLKLNPQKCIFGVRSGKFLGYMVTERGIKANPEKVQAIQDMVSPRGPKDVQQLTGRIAALARFISRSAHRSLPFFRTLRKAKKFEWGPDCEKAFTELKEYLAELPVLAKPAAGEPLWVYLSATEGAMSSVLVKSEGSVQQPVYYVSHALKGAEIRYSGLEKLALALVMTARRLRPYFLSHPIVVLTNSPLGRILTHSDMSGRLIKWTTELGEYDIQYEPRTSIKAQALADFLAETVHLENEDPWKVYVDGSSSKDGSGVGVVLISPAGEEVKLAVRLDFRASNNEAEYEAVLAGLRAARNVGATRVLIFSDSQLVAQQMKGMYDVKDEKLIEYAREVDRVREKFTEITFEQIPRKENEKADALA
ncbi:uncharacterized protein [Primulina eburnea]|uniref:uncharacterized protein n=1 Tax=Primulina eburnea TaxID=1245227 RepID=UPI003C6C8DD5